MNNLFLLLPLSLSLSLSLLDTPYSLRVFAVYDAKEAFDASRKRGTAQHDAGKFRSIRDRIQSIKFRQEDYSNSTWFPTLIKGMCKRERERERERGRSRVKIFDKLCLIIILDYHEKSNSSSYLSLSLSLSLLDGTYKTRIRKQSWGRETQLVYDKKRWFAVFTVEYTPEKSTSQKIIALDPGVRTKRERERERERVRSRDKFFIEMEYPKRSAYMFNQNLDSHEKSRSTFGEEVKINSSWR